MENLTDKTLVCQDCSKEFVFTAGEQEYYISKMLGNEPKRCKDCRQAKKDNRAPRELFTITCSECQKPAQVPHPNMTLCRDCFLASKNK